jgi:hypothetical protein
MTAHRITRLAAALALAAGSTCGTAILATPASAAVPMQSFCVVTHSIAYQNNSIVAQEHEAGPTCILPAAAVIYRGTTVVASATGPNFAEATYTCQGTATSTYTDTFGDTVTAACS